MKLEKAGGLSARKETYLSNIQGKYLQSINEDETMSERAVEDHKIAS